MLFCLENKISSYYINPKLYDTKDVEIFILLIHCNTRTFKHVPYLFILHNYYIAI